MRYLGDIKATLYNEVVETKLPFLAEWNALVLLVLLLVMFLLSYIKQTVYIKKIIKARYYLQKIAGAIKHDRTHSGGSR